MPLSANTLSHFTKNKSSLKKILSDNFKIFYCKEIVNFGAKTQTLVVPMVSFCDIPLSEIKQHIFNYGEYGLGMSKEWGVKNGLNPVLYLAPNSSVAQSYPHVTNYFKSLDNISDSTADAIFEFLNISRYFKNYEGNLTRHGKTKLNFRYSDEREWRYVPPYSKDFKMLFMNKYDQTDLQNSQDKLNSWRLKFEPNDIKYIFIKNDSEIEEFIYHIRAVMSDYPHKDLERLFTRLLTSAQIKEDI